MMRSPTWPLSPGDICSVSDEDAFDFADILEIALSELPEEGVAPPSRVGGIQRGQYAATQSSCRFLPRGRFSIAAEETRGFPSFVTQNCL
jgi:hypothetical protein